MLRRRWAIAWPMAALLMAGLPHALAGEILKVGPGRIIKTPAQAALVAREGSIVQVDAGDYPGDVAVWTRDGVTIRAVGGRVRVLASGAAAEGKGLWVVRAERMVVEGFDFVGARVPDTNGAGIRLERGSLTVRDCRFLDNEMGLLTGNDPHTVLVVEHSEFAHNRRAPRHSHQLYVGAIAQLTVTGSHFHHGQSGHLLKSRAAVNRILYNRLTDESGGTSSYELEFPNGGVAVVMGNLIQQAASTENHHMVSYGAEGYRWPHNALHLSHNTLVDDRPSGGVFLSVAPGAAVDVRSVNNLLVGRGDRGGFAAAEGNLAVAADALADAAAHDYRLRAAAPPSLRLAEPGAAAGMALRPTREYLHPRQTRALDAAGSLPGALQSRAGP